MTPQARPVRWDQPSPSRRWDALPPVDPPPEVWRVHLDQPHDPGWWDTLSPRERARASRFACPEQRRRYTVAHAALRSILARACGVPADDLPFAAEPGGRPYLALPGDPPDFNLSHAGEWALVALAPPPWRVGVDIEQINPYLDWHAMAQRLYHPTEVDLLTAAGPFLGRTEYFLLWSAKEAYIKATGAGLPALHDAHVHRSPADPTRGTIQSTSLAGPWPVLWLPAPAGYTAALVTTQCHPPAATHELLQPITHADARAARQPSHDTEQDNDLRL